MNEQGKVLPLRKDAGFLLARAEKLDAVDPLLAVELTRSAVEAASGEGSAAFLLAFRLMNVREHDQALRLLSRLWARDDMDIFYALNIAVCFAEQGRPRAAARVLERAGDDWMRGLPGNLMYCAKWGAACGGAGDACRMAESMLRDGRPEAARALLERPRWARNPLCLPLLAEACERCGEPLDAEVYASECVPGTPYVPRAVSVLRRLGRTVEARQLTEAAGAAGASTELAAEIGECGLMREAQAQMDEMLEENPNDARLAFARAAWLYRCGQRAQAARYWRRLARQNDFDEAARRCLRLFEAGAPFVPPFARRVPEEAVPGMLAELRALDGGTPGAASRSLLCWALSEGGAAAREAAFSALGRLGDLAEEAARDALATFGLAPDVRVRLVRLLARMGATPPYAAFADGLFQPLTPRLRASGFNRARSGVLKAMLEAPPDVPAIERLARVWDHGLCRVRLPLRRPEAWAAALYLASMPEKRGQTAEYARLFGCGERSVRRRLRAIERYCRENGTRKDENP